MGAGNQKIKKGRMEGVLEEMMRCQQDPGKGAIHPRGIPL